MVGGKELESEYVITATWRMKGTPRIMSLTLPMGYAKGALWMERSFRLVIEGDGEVQWHRAWEVIQTQHEK